MNDINALANWIRENALTEENRHANGEVNWNFVEADIELTACGLATDGNVVRDPLPALPFKPSYEEIDAAFELVSS